MKKIRLSLFALTLIWGTGQALATQLISNYSFTTTATSAAPSQVAFISVNPFDTSLGSLNSVNISIAGTLSTIIRANLISDGAGGYQILPFISYDNQKFVGANNQYFQFDTPAIFSHMGVTGVGSSYQFDDTFNYTLSFDKSGSSSFFLVSSDASHTSPTSITGSLTNFLPSASYQNKLMFFDTLTSMSGIGFDFYDFTNTVSGTMTVTYDFENN